MPKGVTGNNAYREMTDAEGEDFARRWEARHDRRNWHEAEKVIEIVRLLLAESSIDPTGWPRQGATAPYVSLDAARLLRTRLARYDAHLAAVAADEARPRDGAGLPERGLVSTGEGPADGEGGK